ncbi:MAG: hypothetical protein JXQ87_15800 [Bacteroidia bacterium]
MKRSTILQLGAIIFLGFFTSSCIQDSCNSTKLYRLYTPVYETMDNIRGMVEMQEAQEMEDPGKIYVYGDYMFMNEKGKGIHLINVSDKANPVTESFIKIPGNVDMAVQGTYLYADNFIDLVVFDLSDLSNIKEVGRELNVFPENVSVHERAGHWLVDKTQGVAIDWEVEEIEVDCDSDNSSFLRGGVVFAEDASVGNSGQSDNGGGASGAGGSMARFTLMSNHLYVIDDSGIMHLFDLNNPTDPTKAGHVDIAWNIETIFPFYRGEYQYLFIGAQDGMYIYDNNTPTAPFQMSKFVHVNSCDPVVAHDTVAFVTLRNGTECEGFSNELQLIDIRDLNKPELISTYDLHNPHGLGYDNGLLFICDANEGLKVYDISQSLEKVDDNLIEHFTGFFAYDVIPFKGTLYLSTDKGLYLVDYTDKGDITIKSKMLTGNL